ncbi:MAG: CsgG/HfaB family protein [Lautropia sp.]|nr:CsgG/HfaB family protein [Lautropia sp.]
MKKLAPVVLSVALLGLAGCATEGSRVIESPKVASYGTTYHGQKSKIAVGKFANKSSFQNGIFSDGVDRLGNQSKTILMAHLQQTGRFSVLDRSNMDETAQEAKIRGSAQNMAGASYIVTGDVTEFGRKDLGDRQLFGLLGRGKKQVAYAKVTLNVVNVNTTEVVYSSQGAGEYDLSNREVLGFGGTAGYDATLNGKVLDLAIREAVNNLIAGIESNRWTPEN